MATSRARQKKTDAKHAAQSAANTKEKKQNADETLNLSRESRADVLHGGDA